MAQEFYKAFGNDGIGKIGCDTLINSADIDGVMMIGLQALEKRSTALTKENEQLKADNLELKKEMTAIKKEFAEDMALLEIKINDVAAAKEKTAAVKNIVVINK